MTTTVTVQAASHSVQLTTNEGRGGPDSVDTMDAGDSRTVYIHGSMTLQVKEVEVEENASTGEDD